MEGADEPPVRRLLRDDVEKGTSEFVFGAVLVAAAYAVAGRSPGSDDVGIAIAVLLGTLFLAARRVYAYSGTVAFAPETATRPASIVSPERRGLAARFLGGAVVFAVTIAWAAYATGDAVVASLGIGGWLAAEGFYQLLVACGLWRLERRAGKFVFVQALPDNEDEDTYFTVRRR